MMLDQQPPARRLVVRNNILSYGLYGMYGSGVGSGNAALATFAPDAIFDGNVVYGFITSTRRAEVRGPAGRRHGAAAKRAGAGDYLTGIMMCCQGVPGHMT